MDDDALQQLLRIPEHPVADATILSAGRAQLEGERQASISRFLSDNVQPQFVDMARQHYPSLQREWMKKHGKLKFQPFAKNKDKRKQAAELMHHLPVALLPAMRAVWRGPEVDLKHLLWPPDVISSPVLTVSAFWLVVATIVPSAMEWLATAPPQPWHDLTWRNAVFGFLKATLKLREAGMPELVDAYIRKVERLAEELPAGHVGLEIECMSAGAFSSIVQEDYLPEEQVRRTVLTWNPPPTVDNLAEYVEQLQADAQGDDSLATHLLRLPEVIAFENSSVIPARSIVPHVELAQSDETVPGVLTLTRYQLLITVGVDEEELTFVHPGSNGVLSVEKDATVALYVRENLINLDNEEWFIARVLRAEQGIGGEEVIHDDKDEEEEEEEDEDSMSMSI